MNKTVRIALGGLALAGLGVSIYLALFHFRLLSDPNFESACKFSETLDCDKVNSSIYAKPFGIPLGLYGAAFYATILALVGFSFARGEKFARALELIFGLSVLAVLLSLVLAYLSAFAIGAWCVFCISLYVINLLLLVVSYRAAGGGIRTVVGGLDRELKGFYRSPMIYTSVFLFGGLTLVSGSFYRDRAKEAQDATVSRFMEAQARENREKAREARQSADVAANLPAEPGSATPPKPHEPDDGHNHSDPSEAASQDKPVALTRQGHEPVRGKVDAPVTVTVFSDFQCPYCKNAALILDEVLKKNPGRMSIVYKQYPLDSDCNANLSTAMHENACEATIASMCAQRQGQFWEMHDLLFRNQNLLAPEQLEGHAQSLGLDMVEFKRCQQDRSVILDLVKDIDQAQAIAITGTPSIYVNGRKWKGALDPEAFSQLVQQLAAASGAPR